MKLIIFFLGVVLIGGAALIGYKMYNRHQVQNMGVGQENRAQQEEAVPTGGDLCGGTGGIGEIVSTGKNTITLKKKDGNKLLTHLTDKTEIHVSSGSVSQSDLKMGDRVTLVGGPISDGSFNADAVFVCAATK